LAHRGELGCSKSAEEHFDINSITQAVDNNLLDLIIEVEDRSIITVEKDMSD
jgi:hypothetical protein